jgi:hypothetical protein
MSCQKSNVVVGCLDINQTFVATKTLEILQTKNIKLSKNLLTFFQYKSRF